MIKRNKILYRVVFALSIIILSKCTRSNDIVKNGSKKEDTLEYLDPLVDRQKNVVVDKRVFYTAHNGKMLKSEINSFYNRNGKMFATEYYIEGIKDSLVYLNVNGKGTFDSGKLLFKNTCGNCHFTGNNKLNQYQDYDLFSRQFTEKCQITNKSAYTITDIESLYSYLKEAELNR